MQIRGRRRETSYFDMTPLIDVVFLLLIFFMVSTTFERETQLKVDLPEASAQPKEERPDDRIEIAVDKGGRIYVDQQELVTSDLPTLVTTLERQAGERRDQIVIVDADKNAPFQAVVVVMDAAGQLGLQHVRFMAHRDPDSKTP